MVMADLALDSFGYRALLFLHILCMIVGFGSSFVYPLLGKQAKERRGIEAKALSESSLAAAHVVTTPVIYVGGAIGLLLVLLGQSADFDDVWVQVAILVFLGAVLFARFVHVPNLERMNTLIVALAAMGPPPADAPPGPPPQAVELEQRGAAAARNGGILQLSLVVLLYLMVWKPGA